MARQHPSNPNNPVDLGRGCQHRSGDTYTHEPCSCGRPLWPPRGRGRGESLLSPRRIAATLRTAEALRLRIEGATYAAIARQLGYRTRGGAWRAIHRALARYPYGRTR